MIFEISFFVVFLIIFMVSCVINNTLAAFGWLCAMICEAQLLGWF